MSKPNKKTDVVNNVNNENGQSETGFVKRFFRLLFIKEWGLKIFSLFFAVFIWLMITVI